MGIGFVLFIWLVICLGLAAGISVAFGLVVIWLTKGARRRSRITAILASVMLPPVSVVCGLAGFIGYAMWCESARGVDPGIGDLWRVPLGSGYELLMVDTPEQALVKAPGDRQFDLGSGRLGFDDQSIYFETQGHGWSLIEKSTGRSTENLTEAGVAATLRTTGSPPMRLRSPRQAYSDLRWGVADALAIPMVCGVPAILTIAVMFYIWKVWRSVAKPRTA